MVAEGVITADQLKLAQEEEKRTGLRLRQILIKTGLMSEEDLVLFLSEKLDIPRIELGNYLIDPAVIDLVPEELARKHDLVPVLKIGDRLTCAMVDPWNIFALDEVRAKTNFVVEPAVATEGEIKKSLNEHYGAKGTMEELLKSLDKEKLGLKDGQDIDLKKLEVITKEPVVIKLVNLIIMKAVQEGASDVHIEPEEDFLKIRFRVDGILHEEPHPPRHLQAALTSRIKILANLNIAERRAPQDGRFNIKMEGKEVDVRVSCMPTLYGENVVLRLLDVTNALLKLSQLGFAPGLLEAYQKLITKPHGIILVTGPTGSGKTTALYASLDKINTVEKNIITIEDPIEYRLAGVRQTQVNPKVNLTFATGLRSILRQDPNVIMVGEIRDFETAEIAVEAALTGHLVFSTLHTNDAPGAISRLVDMKIEPYLIASSLLCVLAQRLVRTICKDCREEEIPSPAAQKEIGLDPAQSSKMKFYRGRGCSKCMNTGYKGRIGIFELLVVDDELRNLITAKAPIVEIRNKACSGGMVLLREAGIEKIREGLTSVEEILRVTQEE